MWCVGWVASGWVGSSKSISFVYFSILITGYPKGFFSVQRGLRQGSRVSQPYVVGLQWGQPSQRLTTPTMNHLQFADNTLLCFDTKEDNVKIVIAILRCFNAVLGLRLASPRVCTWDFSGFSSLDYFADIMGCRVDSFPSTYLGLPLFLGSEFLYFKVANLKLFGTGCGKNRENHPLEKPNIFPSEVGSLWFSLYSPTVPSTSFPSSDAQSLSSVVLRNSNRASFGRVEMTRKNPT